MDFTLKDCVAYFMAIRTGKDREGREFRLSIGQQYSTIIQRIIPVQKCTTVHRRCNNIEVRF